MVYIYNGIILSHKKEWNIAICSNMDGPRDNHTRWSKSDREKEILYYLYVESKKIIQINLFMKQKQTHKHRKQTYGYQSGKARVGRDKLGVWD